MSVFVWILGALVIYLALTAFIGMASSDERLSDAFIAQAGGAAILFAVTLIVWPIVAVATGEDEAKICTDKGNIWYDVRGKTSLCYSPEQYKIVKEAEKE